MVDFVASHAGPLVCIKYQKYKLHGDGESSIKFSHAMAAMVQGKLQIWRWNALNGHAKQFLKPLRGSKTNGQANARWMFRDLEDT